MGIRGGKRSGGYIDIHSHILPQMDDGSRSIEQSLQMLRIAAEEGIAAILATPHDMPGKGHPREETVRTYVRKLQALADREGIPIWLETGMEYYYREEVLELLEAEKAVTLGKSSCVLIEFEPMAERRYVRNACRNVLDMGYCPVVAHVERYAHVMEELSMLQELRQMGCLIQINAASVVGGNGRLAKKNTRSILREGMADFVATDAHSDGRRAPLMRKCAETLYRRYGAEYADRLLFGNAEAFFPEDEDWR